MSSHGTHRHGAASASGAPVRVLLACSGLGRVRRGYEAFTEQCFNALGDDDRLDVVLAKGAGDRAASQHRVPSIPQASASARVLGRLARRDAYFVEQATFAAALVPLVSRFRPHVVFYSDFSIGEVLERFRGPLRTRFRLLFRNGAPRDAPFGRADRVQHLTRYHLERALADGEPPDKHVHLPSAFELAGHEPVALAERPALRRSLGLPDDAPIVVSVGVLKRSHKRHHHVIHSCARAESKPFLVLLGERDPETPGLEAEAARTLGPDRHVFRTTSADGVPAYYGAADVCVLASLYEGFPRAPVEAVAAGLPCLVHDYPIVREILGSRGTYLDMEDREALGTRLDEELAAVRNETDARRHARHRALVSLYDWSVLKERYVEMLVGAAA